MSQKFKWRMILPSSGFTKKWKNWFCLFPIKVDEISIKFNLLSSFLLSNIAQMHETKKCIERSLKYRRLRDSGIEDPSKIKWKNRAKQTKHTNTQWWVSACVVFSPARAREEEETDRSLYWVVKKLQERNGITAQSFQAQNQKSLGSRELIFSLAYGKFGQEAKISFGRDFGVWEEGEKQDEEQLSKSRASRAGARQLAVHSPYW